MKQHSPLSGACKKYEEDLVLYYYAEGGAADSQRVERHLSECLACRDFVEDLRGLLPQSLRQVKRLAVDVPVGLCA